MSASLWDRIDVALPELSYRERLPMEGKGSTEWAAHSHSPAGAMRWEAFDAVVVAQAASSPQSQRILDWNFAESLKQKAPDIIMGREEDVTACTLSVLSHFGKVIQVLKFETNTWFILSSPDIVVSYSEQDTSEALENRSVTPERGKLAQARRELRDSMVANYLFPIETKPYWKFQFLLGNDSTERMVEQWEMPVGYSREDIAGQRPLPKSWSDEKGKVFHLIRQVYGQMVESRRKYGVIHIYERWWFCQRTDPGDLMISRPFHRSDVSPSVFQAILALAMMPDHSMPYAGHNLQSPTPSIPKPSVDNDDNKGDDKSRPRRFSFNPRNLLPKWGGGKRNRGPSGHGTRRTAAGTGEPHVADQILLHDCEVEDATETVQLLSNKKYPGMLIKLQRDRERTPVAQEMEQEAFVYQKLLSMKDSSHIVRDAIPLFYGFSKHVGVAMICLGLEGDDFEDIGLENISVPLKRSAIQSMEALSRVGILHGDIALRNIVQSRENPNHAKIVDFGRAQFSQDKTALREQVESLKLILGLSSSS